MLQLPPVKAPGQTPSLEANAPQNPRKPKKTLKDGPKRGGGGKRETKDLSDYEDSAYSSAEEDKYGRKGGVKTLPLLLEVSRPCYKSKPAEDDVEKGKKYARC